MTEEIQLSLGELESIKRRMTAALQLAEHPERDLTIYLFELASTQLLSLLQQSPAAQPDKGRDTAKFWWQTSQTDGKLKH